jgi:hypothetical protein
LSKQRSPHSDETVRVAPSLVDFDREGDVTGPLGQFQAGFLNKDGIGYILTEIAKVVGVDTTAVMKRFNNAWGTEYERRFADAKAVGAEEPSKAHRDTGDMLDEMLTILRALRRWQDEGRRRMNIEAIKAAYKSAPLSSGLTFGASLEKKDPSSHIKMTLPIKDQLLPEYEEDIAQALHELGVDEVEIVPPPPPSTTE